MDASFYLLRLRNYRKAPVEALARVSLKANRYFCITQSSRLGVVTPPPLLRTIGEAIAEVVKGGGYLPFFISLLPFYLQIEEIANLFFNEKRKLKESRSEGEVKFIGEEDKAGSEEGLEAEQAKENKKKGKEKESENEDDLNGKKRKKKKKTEGKKGKRNMHRSRPFSALAQSSSDFEKPNFSSSLASSKSLTGDLSKQAEEREWELFHELKQKIGALSIPIWNLRMQLVSGHRSFFLSPFPLSPHFFFLPSLFLIFFAERFLRIF